MKIENYLQCSVAAIESIVKSKLEIENMVDIIVSCLISGNKVIFCGNGGSAADSQHLAAELMGRFLIDRNPLPALSLTVDTSALTAIANDYGYEQVFSRQLHGIGRKGDVLIGLSTSGTSKNVVEAFLKAREMGIHTIAFVGAHANQLASYSDYVVKVDASETHFIQEAHIVIGHYICSEVENALC